MYKISRDEFEQAYEIIQASFPVSEMRTHTFMEKYFIEGSYQLYGIKKDDVLLGVMMCWECASCVFIENFAISKQARGQGIGSEMLSQIKAQYPDQCIILEVEKPYDEMSERRIGFYNRNQFILNVYGYKQPQINIECNDVPLLIMSYPHRLQEHTFQVIKVDVFKNVYQIEDYK